MTTLHRGYFQVTKGIPPTEADLNAGFLDMLDADIDAQETAASDALSAATSLKTRVDAVISDDGPSSVLIVAPAEFRGFSVGSSAYDPGNTPAATDATHFTVNADWTTEFLPYRRLEVQAPAKANRYPYVVSASFDAVTNKTTVTTAGEALHLDLNEVGLSSIKAGAPQVDPDLVADGLIALAKLAVDVATQAELDAAESALQAQIDTLDTDVTAYDASLTAHAALTGNTHGLGPAETFEHTAGAQSKIDTHDADGSAHSGITAGLQATSEKGANNGYAELNGSGQIPAAQLPNIGLKAIHRGTTTLAAGEGDPGSPKESSTFTAVDPDKTFITASFRTTATAEDKAWTTWELAGTNDRLEFKREDQASSTVTVAWEVVEFY